MHGKQGHHRDEPRIVVATSGLTRRVHEAKVGAGVFRRTQQFRQVTMTQWPHPRVDLMHLVRPELAEFKARDTELSGWLSRPQGHSGASGQRPWWCRRTGEAVFTQRLPGFADRGHRSVCAQRARGVWLRYVYLDNGELRLNGIKDTKS